MAQRELEKERGGEARDGEQEFPQLQGGYYADVGGQTEGGGVVKEKERRRTREREKRQRGIERE